MNKRTKGAWIISHTKKLRDYSTSNFEDLELAGKSGILLSNLAASNEETDLTKEKVEAIAKNSNINKKLELPTITSFLKDAQLIDFDKNGNLIVLGLTSSNILEHTADLFEENDATKFQTASIELSNKISEKPLEEKSLKEYISDNYEMEKKSTDELFIQAEEIGILDFEDLDGEKTYFNGNLFKRDNIAKSKKIFQSFSANDVAHLVEVDQIIINEGCIAIEKAETILGKIMMEKLKSIAYFDFNEVSNYTHTKIYLTKPSSFSKFGNPFEEDIFDMAKAFISSLIYGLQISGSQRGKIQDYIMLRNTLRKLLRGEKVGPCTAIGEDYKVLEANRVIELERAYKDTYYMRLLKFDVAEVALEVIEKGELAEQPTLENFNASSNISSYKGPEEIRNEVRQKRKSKIKADITDIIRTLRYN